MYKENGQLLFSPSDLIRFMKSPYASWMDRYHLEHPGELTPDKATAEEKLVADTGDKHEKKFLAELETLGPVTRIDRTPEAEAETIAAIRAGADCIFQACLRHDNFRGFADFLKRSGTGAAGHAIYEVWDTKLARETKPYYLIQLCCYAEMLEPIQGSLPAKVAVALGSGERPEYSTTEFFNYYRQVKLGFLALMRDFDPGKPPAPQPRADHGHWASYAERWVVQQDHLVQVAGINVSQIRKLNAAGILTVAELAKAGSQRLPKLSEELMARLVEQAELQVITRDARANAPVGSIVPPAYRVLHPTDTEPRRGLALLPPPSRGDVYFDMEGYPLAEKGLEYLFGATTRAPDGSLSFHDWWAHDEPTEQQAFEGFIDWAYARWKEHPDMHIYHYAAYEVSAVKRLMGRYGTRESEVDDLLRAGVWVDLYQVVKQGLRVGEPSYSIKAIEHLYRGEREGDVGTAGESIVFFAAWLESGEPADWQQSPILRKIRDYNRDDCESTLQLGDWLRARQQEHNISYWPPAPKPAKEPDAEKQAKSLEKQAKIEALRALMATLEIKIATAGDEESKRLATLLLHLLEFHRREEKPGWWRLFSRMEMEVEELKEDLDCIGGAELVPETIWQEKLSTVFTYRFDPGQDTKVRAGTRVYALPSSAATFMVEEFDEEGTMEVKISRAALARAFPEGPPALTSFVPQERVSAETIQEAIFEIVKAWSETGKLQPALLRMLKRQPPLLPKGSAGLRASGEAVDAVAVRCVQTMTTSTLCLQGPPGTGKTTCGAKMITALVKQGRSVGVMSNSHKAIENLLIAVCEAAGSAARVSKVGGSVDFYDEHPEITQLKSADAADTFDGGVIGGTAWLFARPEWAGRLDYLFVDEAGQVSLANLVGTSRSAQNLVLLGDQMQLEQPIQGSHPGESGQSALNYYLQGHPTIPEDLGLFLPLTYRLQPEICRFISDLIYEGRLKPAEGSESRRLHAKGAPSGLLPKESGLLFVPVEHDGNVQASDEEAAAIQRLISDLLGRTKIDEQSQPAGPLVLDDILIVAPYNLQVRRLKALLPQARVGSVDKFQGQEAEVVILSMCSSYGEYGSRGLEFLLDHNRMNVALSRARTLAVVVGDPRIALSPAGSIPAMSGLQQTIERRRAADEPAPSPFYSTKDRATTLRVGTSGGEVWLLPWHHFVFGRHETGKHERLVLTFVAHEVAVQGLNLAVLIPEVANQRIEWLRAAPGKYLRVAGDEPSIDQIRVRPLTEPEGGLK